MDAGAAIAKSSYLGALEPNASPFMVSETISGMSDIDIFGFDVRAGQRVIIKMGGSTPASLTAAVRLFDETGSELKASSVIPGSVYSLSAGAFIDYSFAKGSRYFVGVSVNGNITYDPVTGSGGSSPAFGFTGDYRLELSEYQVPYLKVTQLTDITSPADLASPLTKDPVTGLSINLQQQDFFIRTVDGKKKNESSKVLMPSLQFEIVNPPGGKMPSFCIVNWTTELSYITPHYSFTPLKREDTSTTFGTGDLGGIFGKLGNGSSLVLPGTSWKEIWGGDLNIVASFSIGGYNYTVSSEDLQETRNLRILGSNPSKKQVSQYIDSTKDIQGWPDESGYTTQETIAKIARKESDVKQFDVSNRYGYPFFAPDGGVGIMQIDTGSKAMYRDAVWNWQANIQRGRDKLEENVGLPDRLISQSRSKVSDSFNKQAKAYKKSHKEFADFTFKLDIPKMTPMERFRTIVRAYNGAGGTNQWEMPLNEYELQGDFNHNVFLEGPVVKRDAKELIFTARWSKVAASRRKVSRNYVDDVIKSKF